MKKTYTLLIFFSFLLISQCSSVMAQSPLQKVFEKATEAFTRGDYYRAIELYQTTLEIYPNFAPSYHYLGLCHKAVGSDPEEIIWQFKKAIEINPDYAPSYDQLGKVYFGLGEFKPAVKYGAKSVELNPDSMSAQLSLGWIYLMGTDNPGDAVPHFQSVVENYEIPHAYFGLGLAYFQSGQRYRVLEMITALRAVDKEVYARQLERMLHENRYIAPEGELKSFVSPPKRQRSIIIGDQFTNIPLMPNNPEWEKIQVHLK